MEELASQLKKDLALSDRQNPVDVCSPVSDNMVAQLQDDAGDLHEEIEKLLAGGSSLDRNTMERLFQTVVQRLQACWGDAKDKQRAYSTLLGRLRVFDTQHFDGLMVKWLLYLRTLGSRPSILRIFPLLVSVGCLDMSAILATAADFPGSQGTGIARAPTGGTSAPQVVQITYRTRYMQEVLLLLTAPIHQDELMLADEAYRFSILQDQATRECPKEVLGLIFLALAEYSYARGQNDFENLPLESPSVQDKLIELLKRLVLRDATGVARALGVKSPSPHVSGWIDCMTTKLLIPTADSQTHVTFDQVLELTNEFTLPFCQVKLALSLGSNDQNSSQEAADRQQSHVELFANAMDKAISAGNISWVGMLSCLSPDITQHLKVRAQSRFLDLLPSLRTPPSSTATDPTTLAQNLQMADNLLSVMDAIMRGSAPPGGVRLQQPQLAPAVVDKLVDLWELLAAPEDPPPPLEAMQDGGGGGGGGRGNSKAAVLHYWLPLTLNLITLHAQGFDLSKQSNEVRAKMLVACAGLMQELDLVYLPSLPPPLLLLMAGGGDVPVPVSVPKPVDGGEGGMELARRVFDLSCLLVDNLAEDARAMCVRAVGGSVAAAGDGRLRYVLSVPGDGTGEGLVICQREKAVSSSGPGSAGGTPNNRGGAAGSVTPTTLFGGLLGTPAALWGFERQTVERLSVFQYRRWETLSEPTPNVGENDTALSLGLFEARRVQ
jgi:mediator of RNA polymerase II transcription subunit 12